MSDISADPEYRQRFIREADLAARLWHPHIFAVHDRGEYDGQLWIAMDYVEGTDGAHLIRRYPAGLPVGQVAGCTATFRMNAASALVRRACSTCSGPCALRSEMSMCGHVVSCNRRLICATCKSPKAPPLAGCSWSLLPAALALGVTVEY